MSDVGSASTVGTTKKRGRPRHVLWDNFDRGELVHGYTPVKCLHCDFSHNRATVSLIVQHLLQCKGATPEIRKQAAETKSSIDAEAFDERAQPRMAKKQGSLIKHLTVYPRMDEATQRKVSTKLVQFIATAGIPFSAVDNPFFMEMISNLCPSYMLPGMS